MEATNHINAEVRSLAENKRGSVSYYVVAVLFAGCAFYFFVARIVELVDSSFINPFHFPMILVSNLAIASFFITPPKTMSGTVRRYGLTLLVRNEFLFLILTDALFFSGYYIFKN
jgi:hypothetical protein